VDNNDNGAQTGGAQTAVKSPVVTLSAGETDNTIDFGFVPLKLCGQVFFDADYLSDTFVDGVDPNRSGQLSINLIDPVTTLVIGVMPVPADGTYCFSHVLPNTPYTLCLSSNPGVVGQAPPAQALPTGLVFAGEYVNPGPGSDGTIDGCIAVRTGTSDLVRVDFGIDDEKMGIELEKTSTINFGPDGQVKVGDTITYSFKVTNTGNVPLTNVVVTDPGATLSGGPLALLPVLGVDTTTFTATYTITADDLAKKDYINTARVAAVGPRGRNLEDEDTEVANLCILKLCGEVFVDAQPNDSIISASTDTSVATVTVSLFLDRDNNGIPDGPALQVKTTQTGANPGYCFENLVPDRYIVCQNGRSGYSNDTDIDGNTNGRNCIQSRIVDRDLLMQDFLLNGPQPKRICGFVRDGKIPEAGTAIILCDAGGNEIGRTVTDARGAYVFTGILTGSYTIKQTNPTGTLGGTDADGGDPDSISVVVTATDTEICDKDFVDLRTIPQRNACTYCCTTIQINPLRDIPFGRNGGSWSVVGVTQGTRGVATILPNGYIQYVPRKGQEFYGSMTDSIIVTLRDPGSGQTITRTIQICSFESISGTFTTLLTPEDQRDLRFANGYAQVTLSKNAAVTARVIIDNSSYSLSGGLTGPLTFSKVVKLSATATRTFTFIFDDTTDTWSVRVKDTSTSPTLLAVSAADPVGTALRVKKITTDVAGYYTMLMTLNGSPARNDGYATVTVGKTASISMAGEMAFGGAFTTSSLVRVDNTAVIYRPEGANAAKQQRLIGVLDLSTAPTFNSIAGTLEWRYKDTLVTPTLIAAPIEEFMTGYRYTPITATANVVGAAGPLPFRYFGPSSSVTINSTVAGNVTTQTGTLGLDIYRITVNRATGVWAGTLTQGTTKRIVKGVTLQPLNIAGGFINTTTLPSLSWYLNPNTSL
jgi:hypothetical protein